jgi:predicted DNA-binding transcriptional regulator YafY
MSAIVLLTMLETSARLLALLSLLQEHREWTGHELASRLEVGPRTIRRDVDKLRSLGYPVNSARGLAGGYRLGSGARMPPLLFDDAEAVAVAVGLRSAAAASIAGVGETSVQALLKLEQVLPDRLRRRVAALASSTSAIDLDVPVIRADLLSALAGACGENRRVRFKYVDRAGVPSSRVTDPVGVVHSGTNWYLVAFDIDRDDWRTFRLDRIDGTPHAGERGIPRSVPGGDPAAFIKERRDAVRATEGGTEPARIRVRARAATIRGRIPHGYATVEEEGEEACLVTTRGPWSLRALFWIAQLEHPIEIVGPPELIERASVLSRRLSDSLPQAG